MPNQFQPQGSLQEKMESHYKMPFKEAMIMLARRGMSRNEVAEEFSCSHATVVKHSLRLGVEFKRIDSFRFRKINKHDLIKEDFIKHLKMAQINPINALSKKW